jgi:chaperonin GroES
MGETKLNYQPRGDRVIVKRLERPALEEGNVFLPKSQQKPLDEGIVVAVGPGARNRVTGYIDEIDMKEGDHICFLEYAGQEVTIDGEIYLSLRDEEVHGRRQFSRESA